MAPSNSMEDAIEINFDSITREHTVFASSRAVGQSHYLIHSVVVIAASPKHLGNKKGGGVGRNTVRSLSPRMKRRRRSSQELAGGGRASSLLRESSLTRCGRERSRSQASRNNSNTSLTRRAAAAARDASPNIARVPTATTTATTTTARLLKRPLLYRSRESSLQPCSGFCPTCLPQQEGRTCVSSRFPPLPRTVRRPTLYRSREASLQPCSGSCRTCLANQY
jgi:hypothetical protein